ncbi:CorA family divalent cation transporter, partial [Hydrogenovibrio sp. 3SP14C1]|uniref:CorA family divalent cation transporter n=1 Tax=Hydrogenovibrio sp. 3SP14C1 TaxID=3038774 RepID=UPI0024168592
MQSGLLRDDLLHTWHRQRYLFEKFERLHSMTEMYYDQLSDLVHGYMSTTSHQINERMKVLTMVSTIFIPLTYLAGVYGMNFHNM